MDGRLGSEFMASKSLRARESTEAMRGASSRVLVARSWDMKLLAGSRFTSTNTTLGITSLEYSVKRSFLCLNLD